MRIKFFKLTLLINFLFVEYPEILHNEHNTFPVCPSHKKIPKSLLSPYQREQATKLNIKPGVSEKLIADLTNKDDYVLHYRNLQQVIGLGLKVKKIKRILSFNQCRWLAPFIEYNTRMRQNAKTKFEKDFWKLMSK